MSPRGDELSPVNTLRHPPRTTDSPRLSSHGECRDTGLGESGDLANRVSQPAQAFASSGSPSRALLVVVRCSIT